MHEKHPWKRLLSVLICGVMLLGLLPTAALADEIDTDAPVLSFDSVNRGSDTAATVGFLSNEAGTYYFAVAEADGAAPTIDTTGTGTACDTSVQTISLTLTAGAKDLYIVVKDAAGNVSEPLKVRIPEYAPTVIDGFRALADATTLPASFDYTLGTETLYSIPEGGGLFVYAKLLKVQVSEEDVGSQLNISFAGKNGSLATGIVIYRQNGESIELMNVSGSGSYVQELTNAGTYYIALCGQDETVTGLCHAELFLSPAPVSMIDGFQALEDATELPASFDYTLGSDNILYSALDGSGNTHVVSAKLLKVQISEEDVGSQLNIGFAGKTEDIDTTVWVFQDNGGTITLLERQDNDNLNGEGEYAAVALPDAGTYYIALASHCDNERGLCQAELSLSLAPVTMGMIEGFQALTETTELPSSFDYTLGSDNILYTALDENGDECVVFAKLLKVEMEENAILNISFAGKTADIDTTVWLFRESDGTITLLERQDNDNLNGYGESAAVVLPDAGTYYIALASHCENERGLCSAEISAMNPQRFDCLDFTADPVPEPEEGDKWSWDPESKTLTLKDGFSLYCADDDAIRLPDGAAIVVEGSAQIASAYDDGIEANGALTIKGGENARLTISAYDDGITADGDVLIEDCGLKLDTGDIGVCAYGGITVSGSDLDITCEDEGLYSDKTGTGVTIFGSNVRITAGEEGIQTYGGDILISGSDVNIDTTSDEEGIHASGNLTVRGGRLVVAALENALEASSISLADVVFDIRTMDSGYDMLDMDDPEGFCLPGAFRLYDIDGNLLYEGEWTDDLLNGGTLYVDNTPVFRAVSICQHNWSDTWESNATHHWHECSGAYCDIKENEDKDGYGAHEEQIINAVSATETTDGYTGDTACKICGYLIAQGTVIPATGKTTDPTDPTGPTDPSAPTDPSVPTDPSAPTDPAEPTKPADPNAPATGDSSNPLLWIGLILVSCVGIAGIALFSGKKRAR